MDLSTVNLVNGMPAFGNLTSTETYFCSDFLRDLSRGKSVQEIARSRELNKHDLKKFLEEMSVWFKNIKNFE